MSKVTKIYMNKQKDHIVSEASASEKYIILQNEHLEAENQRLQKAVNKHQKEIIDIESENDKMEQQKTYMGGIIKNCVELDKSRQKIAINMNIKQKHQDIFLKKYKTKMVDHTRVLQTIMSMILIFSFQFSQSHMDFGLMLISMCFIASFQESLIINLNPPRDDDLEQRINKLLKEVETVTVAQKHLENYISEL